MYLPNVGLVSDSLTVHQMRKAITGRWVGCTGDTKEELEGRERWVNVWIEAATQAIQSGRVFDFGKILFDVFLAERDRSCDLVSNQYVKVPFTDPFICHVQVTFNESELSLSFVAFQTSNDELFVCPMTGRRSGNIQLLEVMSTAEIKFTNSQIMFTITPTITEFKRAENMEDGHNKVGLELGNQICNFFFVLVTILATDNVPIERETPSPKLQAARRKAGKPPIPSHFTVRTEGYVTALTKKPARHGSPTGTHASPIMHLRRGHLRRLPAGTTTWVRDCLVNARDGDALTRMAYSVSA